MSVLQGRVVGGSTVVNDALCFQPPPEIEERWAAYGAPVSIAELKPFVDEAELAMRVTQIPKEMINRANYLVGLGAARLGWKGNACATTATAACSAAFGMWAVPTMPSSP